MTSAYYRGAVGAIVAFDVTKVSLVIHVQAITRISLNPIKAILPEYHFNILVSIGHFKIWIHGWNNSGNIHTTILLSA